MKEPRLNQAATRREFLHGGARYAALAGIAAVVAAVAGRHDDTLPGQTCVSNGFCRGCAVVSDCGLPQALSFKQATKGRGT